MILSNARGFEYGVRHFYSPKSGLLSDIICESLEMPKEQAEFLISFGCVYAKSQRVLVDQPIDDGTYLRVHSKPRRFPLEKRSGDWTIELETKNYVIINKPHGLPCHSTVDNVHENLLAEWTQRWPHRPLFLTHRLDVPTSGLLVLGKSLEAQRAFNHLLKTGGQIRKVYEAELSTPPHTWGFWEHWMEDSPKAPKNVQLLKGSETWQLCQLKSAAITDPSAPHRVLAQFELLTGRTHQIRAQSKAMEAPLVGDVAYGASKLYDYERIHLTATEISFEDPISREIIHHKIKRSF